MPMKKSNRGGEVMSTLESIVLSLPDSQALVKAGVVLDTALVWFVYGESVQLLTREQVETFDKPYDTAVPAPVLSELLDAVRARVSSAIISIFHRRDFGVDIDLDDDASAFHYGVGQYPSDPEAAAALLMEISK